MAAAAALKAGRPALRVAAVTGATGFVGRALCRRLLAEGVQVRALARAPAAPVVAGCEVHAIGDLAQPQTDFAAALRGVDAVFHLAAIAHAPGGGAAAIRAVNVEATERLARAAFAAGIALVHASSIKVHGEESDAPIGERSPLRPADDYGRSKRDAEQAIERAAGALDGRWIALRPPIVFGSEDRGNFRRLVQLACAGWPLPLAELPNRRSMIEVGVLADALVHAAGCAGALRGAYVVGGGPALSTSQWLQAIAAAAGCRCRLFRCPPAWLERAAALAGAGGVARRLLRSLEVDDRRWCADAGWAPPRSQDDAIADAVRALRRR